MPGFIGGSTGSSGTGGEITFPREFIDPVTKLRVSQPETLIDTDFEYGLQPTKWETVELINNTPSFFSKGGDTTIPNITSITTNAGTREITVNTLLEHGLAVGIPINVTGTKSVTADGAYIIASIPTTTSFTYLCKDNQGTTLSIEDLYTSIITGEFFQGSQIRVSDSAGIVTDGASVSTLTVTTDSAHGFKVDTPFYFLNLNSTISQEFQAANSTAKSFDSSNSATAQTFDGSNTLSSINIDWSNSATVGGVTSSIASVNTTTDIISVTHTTENFSGKVLGTPLYYNVVAASGFFANNPRGVVFLNSTATLGTSTSSFTVSDVPGGTTIDLTSSMTGTFQLANQARTFAGNNTNASTQTSITIVKDAAIAYDGGNNGGVLGNTGTLSTVTSYSGSLVNVTSDSGANLLDYYIGAMVYYTTTGAAATGLTANTTYWIDSIFQTGQTANYAFTLRSLPNGAAGSTVLTSISGGTGTQKFQKIGISVDKDIFHVKNHGYVAKDMLYYTYPTSGHFGASGPETKDYYFVENAYDSHNFTLTTVLGVAATGGTVTSITDGGTAYTVHSFTTVGTSTFTVTSPGTVDILLVAGGGGGGSWVGGGGGAGGVVLKTDVPVTAGPYSIVVGDGGAGGINPGNYTAPFPSTANGGNSTGLTFTAIGGGHGGSWSGDASTSGGSGGGSSHQNATTTGTQPGSASGGFGNGGGSNNGFGGGGPHATSGGGGAGAAGQGTVNDTQSGSGGVGRAFTTRTGAAVYYGGGGGGGMHGPGYSDSNAGLGTRNNSTGGGGNGKHANNTLIADQAGVDNTGGGGGGGGRNGGEPSYGGKGGSGIVVIRYKA